jgi:hypothetical protein
MSKKERMEYYLDILLISCSLLWMSLTAVGKEFPVPPNPSYHCKPLEFHIQRTKSLITKIQGIHLYGLLDRCYHCHRDIPSHVIYRNDHIN